MIYTHVSNRGGRGVRSPADTLWTRFPGPREVRQLSEQSNELVITVPPERQLLPGESDLDDWRDTDAGD